MGYGKISCVFGDVSHEVACEGGALKEVSTRHPWRDGWVTAVRFRV